MSASTVTPPRSGIPLAWVMVNGQRLAADPDPEWLRYFSSVFNRVGGVDGPGTNDLALSQFEDAGIEETKALLAIARDELGQIPAPADPLGFAPYQGEFSQPSAVIPDDQSGELAALRSEVDALRQAVQALQQGATP